MDAVTLVDKIHTFPFKTFLLTNGRTVSAIPGQTLCENFSIKEIEHLVDTESIMRLEIFSDGEIGTKISYLSTKVFEVSNHYMVTEKMAHKGDIRNFYMVLGVIVGMFVEFYDWSVFFLYYATLIIMRCAALILGLAVAIVILQRVVLLFTAFVLKPGVWILPNAFGDVGFFESFKPLWVWAEEGSKAIKKE